MKATSADAKNSFVADRGRWTIPGQALRDGAFGGPGPGPVQARRRAAAHRAAMRMLRFCALRATCTSIRRAWAWRWSVRPRTRCSRTCPRRRRSSGSTAGRTAGVFRVAAKGEFKVEPLSGIVHLEPLPESRWTLRKQDNGSLMTEPIPLTEQEERLTGSVEVEVRTFAGVRHLRLPAFELAYTPAPMRVECTFTDPREALWVGELHRQPLTISVFPVFDRLLDQARGLFPETLAGMHIRTIDLRSGTTQVMGPDNRLLERPQPGGPRDGRSLRPTSSSPRFPSRRRTNARSTWAGSWRTFRGRSRPMPSSIRWRRDCLSGSCSRNPWRSGRGRSPRPCSAASRSGSLPAGGRTRTCRRSASRFPDPARPSRSSWICR